MNVRFPLIFLCSALVPALLAGSERSGPRSPQDAQSEFQLADPDLVIELVASEPTINSPVAITWDADGKLFVVEMSDYPLAMTGGKIKRLEDRDGDGVYETATLFAEGLRFPSGALPWNGGLLVTCAPDILYFKDTDGDGKADQRNVLLTGFAEGNQQLRVNGLLWGLDNWVYGANGRSGGTVHPPSIKSSEGVSIQRRDFRFRPAERAFEALAGFSQFGLTRDDFNHRFLSWNTIPIRHVVLEERDLNRNPLLIAGESVALIAEPGDTGRIYPVSSPPTTFNRERTDYFNASCGLALFRGNGLGRDYRENAFVAEPLTNLVHRKVLAPQGVTFVARRAEQGREFLAARDRWFHPVNLATGPDDCLYIADFYREWVEHPGFVPEKLRESVDFRAGHEHGRLWRIRRRDFAPSTPAPALSSLTSAELAGRLNASTAWVRDTAQRLLVERQERSAIPILMQLATESPQPVSRVHALWTLAGHSALSMDCLSRALRDPAAEVREQGVLLYRTLRNTFSVTSLVLALVNDPEPRVRLQATLAAGDLKSPESLDALCTAADRDSADKWHRLAILSGLTARELPFIDRIVQQRRGTAALLEEPAILHDAATTIGMRNDPLELERLVKLISHLPETVDSAALGILSGLCEGLARRESSLSTVFADPSTRSRRPLPNLDRLIVRAKEIAADRTAPESRRLLAMQVVLHADPMAARVLIPALLASEESPAVHSAAASGVALLQDADLARALLERWTNYRVNTRGELIAALVRSTALATPLIEAVEAGAIAPTELEFNARSALARIPNPDLQSRAAKVFPAVRSDDREAVVMKHQSVLQLNGDPALGAKLFAQHCQGCHRVAGKGTAVGPDLSGVASRPPSALLEDILDPAREIAPDFVNYVAVTKQGKVVTGLLAADTPASIRLRAAHGVEETILRVDLEEIRPNRLSLMPAGFEQSISPQQLAHLIEFLRHPAAVSLP